MCLNDALDLVPPRRPRPAVAHHRLETFSVVKPWIDLVRLHKRWSGDENWARLRSCADSSLREWRCVNQGIDPESWSLWANLSGYLMSLLVIDMARDHQITGSSAKWREVHDICGECIAFSDEFATEMAAKSKTAAMLDAIDGKAVG